MVLVPFPAFAPDKSRFNGGAAPLIVNAIPTDDGWGPLNASGGVISAVYAYLTDQSGNRLLDQSGNYLTTVFALGDVLTDESGVVLNDEGGFALAASLSSIGLDAPFQLPADCKGLYSARKSDGTERIFAATATGLYELDNGYYVWSDVSRTVGGAYAATGRWSFAAFGSYLYATNGVDAEQMIDIELGTNFEDNASAPVSKYLAVISDFMFRGNIDGYPYQIQNSAINNPQSNTATIDFSDYQDMPVGDEVMGIVPITGGAHVWMKNAVHVIGNFFASDYLYTRQTMTDMLGTSSPWSIGQFGQDQYGLYTDQGFKLYSGGSFAPIGAGAVDAWFLTECDQNERQNIVAMADPERNILWWAYTNTSGVRKLLGFDYIRSRWCLSDISAQASARMRTFAYTTDTSIEIDDDLLRFAIIDENGRLAYLIGDTLAATIETNEVSLNGPNRSLVNGGRISGDPVNASVVLKTGDYQGGTLTARSSVSPSSRTRFLSLRGDGRVHKLTVTIPAGENWTTVNGIELDVKRSGRS